MPSKIKILEKSVIDQIAAGEVVERPAHLVKELIENSLDAMSDSLVVKYENGGRDIQIQDNGSGMSSDDLSLAVDRHATSKIDSYDDLWTLNSYGYRGEALSAISAVSRFSIISKIESSQAYQLDVAFGVKSKIRQTQSSKGTVIQVSGLFENTPARLKFLKSPNYEQSLIRQTIKASILSNYSVEWKVFENKKLIISVPKVECLKSRAEWLFDSDKVISGNHVTDDGFHLEWAYQSPYDVDSNSKNIWIFVQNRWVQDRTIQAAIMDSFKNLLMHGEFPRIVIKIQVPSEFVDVNIHPTKSQVKFSDSQKIFRAVYHTLQNHLSQGLWNAWDVKNEQVVASRTENSDKKRDSNVAIEQQFNFGHSDLNSTLYKQKIDFFEAKSVHSKLVEKAFESENSPHIYDKKQDLFQETSWEQKVVGRWSQYQVIGQMDLTYIVCQGDTSMILVDQHAAHERVLFERLMSRRKENNQPIQSFLVPLAIDLESFQVELILSQQDQLNQLGIMIEQSGPGSILILSAPMEIKESALVKVFSKLVSDVDRNGSSVAVDDRIRDVISTMACHSAVRAGQSLSTMEMQALLKSMDEFPLSNFCPHGRPVNIDMPFYEIERKFGRIV